ncbi:MAG: GNAT family protein [Rhodothermales bacterium]
MTRFTLGEDIEARSLCTSDAPAVHALITANRAHLDRWLRWSSSVQTLSDVQALITRFEEKEAIRDGFHLGIWDNGVLAGGVVCWYIHRENRNAEVGYWLGASSQGKGLATRAARAVIAHLFEAERLHRIEMQCGVDNTGSRAVAERCGLLAEGIRRDSHWITDRFVNHVVYGILTTEWKRADDAVVDGSQPEKGRVIDPG